jgi:DNA adenine methylase
VRETALIAHLSAKDCPVLKAPFPYFGGKSRVADLVWSRFGDARNYVEPFAGSLAVLLARPHWPFAENRVETVNDKDCFLANFWRALRADSGAVAEHCDWPVNEADLHARHLWLVNVGVETVAKLRTDPDFFDAKIAGWWAWGACQWIGSGWCHHPEWQQLPHLGNAGRGVHRPSQQLPHLGNAGQGDLYEYLAALSQRLRRVRVCCGDWLRVLGPTPTIKQGLTAVFLDPPYTAKATRASGIYAQDDEDIGHAVRDWAVEHGGDKMLRIALCGYEGEYEMPLTWECVPWKARGGYASQSDEGSQGRENATRERIWFSPHCERPRRVLSRSLFAD